MKKEITAQRLLTLIRKHSFENATNADVLSKSRDELVEMAIASNIYTDGLGWLIGQFWEDSDLTEPRKGTPFMDDNGELLSREQIGKELSDEEYAVLVKTHAAALLSHYLYHHKPFDLSTLIPGYPTAANVADDFDFSNQTLCQWMVHAKYQRLAALVCNIAYRQTIEWASKNNHAAQDYYAERCGWNQPKWEQVEDCDAFIILCLDSSAEMARHYAEGRKWGLDDETIRVVDAVWGWAPHVFEEDTIATGREILETANRLMPDQLTIRSDAGARVHS